MMVDGTFSELIKDIRQSDSLFSDLMLENIDTHPIPYFGDPARAKALTVGVNPSAAEFRSRG